MAKVPDNNLRLRTGVFAYSSMTVSAMVRGLMGDGPVGYSNIGGSFVRCALTGYRARGLLLRGNLANLGAAWLSGLHNRETICLRIDDRPADGGRHEF